MARIKNPTILGAGGGAAAPVLEEITVNASGTYTPSTGYDGISKVVASFNESDELTLLRKLINGTATSLTVPSTMTSVAAHLCRKDSSSATLTSVDLGNVTTIGQYAFYNNTYIVWVLQQVDGVNFFPRSVTNIGAYALYYAGYNKRSNNVFVLYPSSAATIGNYAFYYGNCAKVKGAYTSIGSYAFCYCNVNEIDLTCSGTVGDYAFQQCPVTAVNLVANALNSYALNITNSGLVTMSLKVANGVIGSNAVDGCQYVSAFMWDPTSKVTSLGNYAFRGLGARRSGTNTFTLDLTNSTFATVGQYAFYPTSTSYPLKNMHIKLPSTVKTIDQYAFGYLKDSVVECNTDAAPTVSSTNAFTSWSNSYLTCPVGSINAYRTKANLTTIASYIRGKASGLSELPELNSEGYELTWYHDVACTSAVTSDETIDPTATYYCTAGANKVAYLINFTALDCTVAPTDSNNHVYASGESVRVGTVLTLNVTPTDPNKPTPYMQTVNGTTFASGDTFTVSSADVEITAMYWDEVNVPVNPNFGQNSWALIKLGAEMGLAASLWSVGDEKTDSNGNVWRIVDLKPGRYAKVGGGVTNIVIEKVKQYAATTTWYTSSYSEHYGQSALFSKMQSGGSYYTGEDQTLAALVNDNKIIVKASQASSSTTVDVQCGFFAIANNELGFSDFNYATYRETVNNGTTFGAFQYYDGAANTKRVKERIGTTGGKWYWTRSRYSSSYAVYVGSDGSQNYNGVNSGGGACPCVAF